MAQITIHGADGNIVEVIGGQLHVLSTVESEFEHISEHDSLAFSWSMLAVNLGAAADLTALLVQNTSDSLLLHIQDISFSADVASEYVIHTTDGAALTHSGVNVVGLCINRSAPKVAPATATSDEVNNVRGNIIWANRIGADATHTERYGGAIILGKNGIIAVDQVADAALTNCVITGFYKTT